MNCVDMKIDNKYFKQNIKKKKSISKTLKPRMNLLIIFV